MEEIVRVFGINWKLLLIQGVNFGLLLLILWRFLYRPFVKVISERQQKIEKGVMDATKAEERLDEINEEKESIMTAATNEGTVIVNKATESAKAREAKLMKEANAKSERVILDATLKGEEIQKQAHEASKKEVARVAVLATEKLLREKV